MITLHLYRTKPKQKEFGLVLLEEGKLRFLGPMGKAVKATWEYLENNQDQSHTVKSVVLNRERSQASCARHLQVLKRLGLLQRRKQKAECMSYWIGFSQGATSIWDELGTSDIPEINCFASGMESVEHYEETFVDVV